MKRPQSGDPSFLLYQQELDAVLLALADKADLVHSRLNKIPGLRCNKVQGAMYAYPQVVIPEEAWEDVKVRAIGMCVGVGGWVGSVVRGWSKRNMRRKTLEGGVTYTRIDCA